MRLISAVSGVQVPAPPPFLSFAIHRPIGSSVHRLIGSADRRIASVDRLIDRAIDIESLIGIESADRHRIG